MTYDLRKRTLVFARDMRIFIKILPRTFIFLEDAKQVIRSSGSIGANYIEAGEAISKKDELLRIKICRKEAQETVYWLELLEIHINPKEKAEWMRLLREAKELVLILSTIMRKLKDCLELRT
jgi:four helix bundle protein